MTAYDTLPRHLRDALRPVDVYATRVRRYTVWLPPAEEVAV